MLATVVSAQNYRQLDNYMNRCGQNWPSENNVKGRSVLNKPAPEFNFDRQLNSRSLEGEFVVLNMWATWCGGCRILSRDIDTVFFINASQPIEGVKVIGVDAHEGMVDKGFKAEEWWKANVTGYPSVGGAKADALCDALGGGHPSAFLIDDKGIVRGRWDAWSPGVAESIRLAIWALKTVPEQGIVSDLVTACQYYDQGLVEQALFLLEGADDQSEKADLLRLNCYLDDHQWLAVDYIDELSRKYADTDFYAELCECVSSKVYRDNIGWSALLRRAYEMSNYLMNHTLNKGSDYLFCERIGTLLVRYGESLVQSGLRMLNQSARVAAESDTVDQAEKDRLSQLVEQTAQKYGLDTDE